MIFATQLERVAAKFKDAQTEMLIAEAEWEAFKETTFKVMEKRYINAQTNLFRATQDLHDVCG